MKLAEKIEDNAVEVEIILARILCGYEKKDLLECEYYDNLLSDAIEELKHFIGE